MKKILAATDGSVYSQKGLDAAIELAKKFDAKLGIVSVILEPAAETMAGISLPLVPERERAAKAALDGAINYTKVQGITPEGHLLRWTSVAEGIIDIAENEKYDLIVIGSRGLSGAKRILLGGVASRVVNYAQCNVMVIKIP